MHGRTVLQPARLVFHWVPRCFLDWGVGVNVVVGSTAAKSYPPNPPDGQEVSFCSNSCAELSGNATSSSQDRTFVSLRLTSNSLYVFIFQLVTLVFNSVVRLPVLFGLRLFTDPCSSSGRHHEKA